MREEIEELKLDEKSLWLLIQNCVALPVNKTLPVIGSLNMHVLQDRAIRLGMPYDEFSQGLAQTDVLEELVLEEFVPNIDFITALANVRNYQERVFPLAHADRTQYQFFAQPEENERKIMREARKQHAKEYPRTTQARRELRRINWVKNMIPYLTDRTIPAIAQFAQEVSTMSTKARRFDLDMTSPYETKARVVTHPGIITTPDVVRYNSEMSMQLLGKSRTHLTPENFSIDFHLDTGVTEMCIQHNNRKRLVDRLRGTIGSYAINKMKPKADLRISKTETDQIRQQSILERSAYAPMRDGIEQLRGHRPLGEHQAKVFVLASMLATRLGLPVEAISHIGLATIKHDMGKGLIPDAILYDSNKRKQTDSESMGYDEISPARMRLIQEHALIGEFVGQSTAAQLREAMKSTDQKRGIITLTDEHWQKIEQDEVTALSLLSFHQASLKEGTGYFPFFDPKMIPVSAIPVIDCDKYESLMSHDPSRVIYRGDSSHDSESKTRKVFDKLAAIRHIYPESNDYLFNNFEPWLAAHKFNYKDSFNFSNEGLSRDITSQLVGFVSRNIGGPDPDVPDSLRERLAEHPLYVGSYRDRMHFIERGLTGMNDELKLLERLDLLRKKARDGVAIPQELEGALSIAQEIKRDDLALFSPCMHPESSTGNFHMYGKSLKLEALMNEIPLCELNMPKQVGYIALKQTDLGPIFFEQLYFPNEAVR